FSLYVREKGPHRFDLDMTRYAGHLRMDTLTEAGVGLEAHYGRFFDLVLGRDHAVSTLTNMPDMPRFRSWGVDTGRLLLETPDGARHPFRVDTLPDSTLRITSSSAGAFPRPVSLVLSKVDGSVFASRPLARFQNASYMRLLVRADSGAPADTLDYFWNAASRRATPEDHEIARIETVGSTQDTLWAAWRVDPAQDPFGSSRPGFFFAFSGRSAALGRFTCRGRQDVDLVLRLRAADAAWVEGLVQGGCRITTSEKAPADSVLLLDGEFKSRRRNAPLAAPHWKLP
ncbi:MAG TPA: hypothetical protein VK465_01850, partial [Fibrobacteria bacterium]|nr:hypothetical protein [Fibrobacteria bacterium]